MRRGNVSKCTDFEGGNEYFHPAKHSADPQKVLGLSSGGDGITRMIGCLHRRCTMCQVSAKSNRRMANTYDFC